MYILTVYVIQREGGMGRTEAGRKADCVVVGRGGEHDGLGRVEEYIRGGGD